LLLPWTWIVLLSTVLSVVTATSSSTATISAAIVVFVLTAFLTKIITVCCISGTLGKTTIVTRIVITGLVCVRRAVPAALIVAAACFALRVSSRSNLDRAS